MFDFTQAYRGPELLVDEDTVHIIATTDDFLSLALSTFGLLEIALKLVNLGIAKWH